MLPQVDGGGKPGLDHCFVVDGYEASKEQVAGDPKAAARLMATLTDIPSGRVMDVFGTQPGIQVRATADGRLHGRD